MKEAVNEAEANRGADIHFVSSIFCWHDSSIAVDVAQLSVKCRALQSTRPRHERLFLR